MTTLLQLSLWLNIAVLLPVTLVLAADRPAATVAWGAPTPARGILQSIYFAIMVVSAALLVLGDPRATAALLAVQVAYKVSTPFTVGLRNPVVLSNLGISVFHLAALWSARATLGG